MYSVTTSDSLYEFVNFIEQSTTFEGIYPTNYTETIIYFNKMKLSGNIKFENFSKVLLYIKLK